MHKTSARCVLGRRLLRVTTFLIVGVAFAGGGTTARADAIPSAPTDCPRGQVGVSSHGGAGCVPAAPKDCPRGWRGLVGGSCTLTPCETVDNCQPGEECAAHAVCLAGYQDDYYEYGEDEREEHGELEPTRMLASPGLLAGPPAPQKKRPTPIYRYSAVNLCSADVACAAPNTCQTEKICVPAGTRGTAYRGTNVSPARVARKTTTLLASNDARPTEATAPPPVKRGCAGCATTADPASGTGIAALGLGLTALVARRRRR